jgi:transglutaminase-like putative cysteine protease
MRESRRKPREWVKLLSEFGDILVIIALWSTREFLPYTLFIVITLYLLKWVLKFELNRFTLSGSLITLILYSTISIIMKNDHPVSVLSNSAPFFLYLLGASDQRDSLTGWKLGLGLIILALSAAISFEFLLPFIITLYIVNGSVTISLFFLSNEFEKRSNEFPRLKSAALPSRFIRRALLQSLFVFLTAGIIFPLLPRLPTHINLDNRQSTDVGYTEEINTSKWIPYQKEGSSQVALRLYNHSQESFENLIPYGLLRTKTLGLYTGTSWTPNFMPPGTEQTQKRYDNSPATIQIIRENLNTDFLPAPYTTKDIHVSYLNMQFRANFSPSFEWKDHLKRLDRLEYTISTEANGAYPSDKPNKAHLATDKISDRETLQKLADQIFRRHPRIIDKISAIKRFYANEDFKGTLPGDPINKIDTKEVSQISHFLFKSKTGHCELFSEATALLFRLAKVPARLVTGFRIPRFSDNEILTVRMSEAHAWVEVYDEKRGWFPLDVTPKLLWEPGVGDWLREKYDYLSGRWFELVLSYGEKTPTLAQSIKTKVSASIKKIKKIFTHPEYVPNFEIIIFSSVFLLFSGILSFGVVIFLRKKLFNTTFRTGDSSLFYLRLKKSVALFLSPQLRKKWNEIIWNQNYEYIRYGKPSTDEKKIVLKNLHKLLRLFP